MVGRLQYQLFRWTQPVHLLFCVVDHVPMTNFRIASDLHLEAVERRQLEGGAFACAMRARLPVIPGEDDQILMLSGDIVTMYALDYMRPFFEDVNARFRAVLYIPGNHEYWYATYPDVWDRICEKIGGEWGLTKFTFQQGNLLLKADFDDVRVLGTCLWTDFDRGNPLVMSAARRGMVDYEVTKIPSGGHLMPSEIYNTHVNQRKALLAGITTALIEDQKKVFVMTHHAPLRASSHPKYLGQSINPCFYSELDMDLLVDTPTAWVHGHMHDASEYIHETAYGAKMPVYCNPYGYGEEPLFNGYRNDLVVTL